MIGVIMFAQLSVASYGGSDTKTFTYVVPDDFDITIGSIVIVSFGKKITPAVVRLLQTQKPQGNTFKIFSIQKVLDAPALPKSLLSLADWMIQYYASSARSVWRTILPASISAKSRLTLGGDTSKPHILNKLNPDQQKALEVISKSPKPILLQGVTGSGKTEIYLHLITKQLSKQKSAILLLPEILLTEHMIERIQKYFPKQIVVTHSGLTPGKRKALWNSILTRSQSEPLLVIGARSALFSPIKNLGLIVMDEEHEPSYKQESSPHYHARDVAAKLASLSKAQLILGSATPSLFSRFLCDQGRIEKVNLPTRHGVALPNITMVDLRDQKELISSELAQAIEKNLARNKQVLLFLNRRGSASKYLCEHCGYVFACPDCGSGLHFHADNMQLRCHVCAFTQSIPATCPECKTTNLRLLGSGTKKVEQHIRQLFPAAKTLRIDRDSFGPRELSDIAGKLNSIDIIIGTQMIGRGLDLPRLQLVGIINADADLAIADYSSSERTFQLISQAAGRAGRRDEVGTVLIQTYRPNNSILADIATHDFEAFYKTELALRQDFAYPPYGYLLKLSCGFAKAKLAEQRALELATTLTNQHITVLGPVPSYPPRSGNKFRYQLIVKTRARSKLRDIISQLPSYWSAELDPLTLL